MYHFSVRTIGILLLSISLIGECSTTTESSEKADESIFMGHFTVLGLGITSAFVVIVGVATVIACCVDFKGHSVQQFPVFETNEEELIEEWIENTQNSAKQRERDEPSAEESPIKPSSSEAVKASELEQEHPFMRKPEVSSRLDPHEKHARVIEAIYHASGRDLPEQYRAGRKVYMTPASTQPNSPASSLREKPQLVPHTVLSVINEVPSDTAFTGATAVSPLVSLHSEGILAKSASKTDLATTERKKDVVRVRKIGEKDVLTDSATPSLATNQSSWNVNMETIRADPGSSIEAQVELQPKKEDAAKEEAGPSKKQMMALDQTPVPSDDDEKQEKKIPVENKSTKEDESKKNKK